MSKVLEWLEEQGYNFSSMKEIPMTESKMILDHCTVCGAKDDEFCDVAGFQDAKCPRITKLGDRQAAVAQAQRQQELVPVLEDHEQAIRNYYRVEINDMICKAMDLLQAARRELSVTTMAKPEKFKKMDLNMEPHPEWDDPAS